MTDHDILLNNGVAMPLLGLGVFRTSSQEEMNQAVQWAWEAGYRSFDTAQMYGNEDLLGCALQTLALPRRSFFLTSKVNLGNTGYQRTLSSFQESLDRRQTDYLDLFLIHWPGQKRQRLADTWRAMEELYAAGKVRAIGVSNCQPRHLDWLAEDGTVVPAVNQVERNPQMNNNDLLAFCRSRGIQVEAWAPLRRGDLGSPALLQLAEKYHRSPAQIILRWNVQSGVVVIPKSVHRERIVENAAIFDFTLAAQDMALLDSLHTGVRTGSDPEAHDYDDDGTVTCGVGAVSRP